MKHLVVMLLKPFGVRDRLRCPSCGAVGTYKPHGGRFDGGDAKRWLCKWCGFYKNRAYAGEYAARTCVADPKAGCWRPRDEAAKGSKTLPEALAKTKFAEVWPWRG